MLKFNFKAANVKSGSRSTSESAPFMTLSTSLNSFKLNKTAMSALGITEGERIVLFDAFGQGELESNDERFYIAAAQYDIDGVEQGAIVSKKLLGFSYSSVYASMLANDVNVGGMTIPELLDAGLVSSRTNESGNTTYSATKSIVYKLVPFGDEPVEISDNVERRLFQLVYVREEAHTPRK